MDQATAVGRRTLWTIVLAAGGSARLGRPKQLLRKHARTLLTRACALAEQVTPGRVVVVIGSQRLRMQAHLRKNRLPAAVVFNSRWPQGLGSSLAAGVKALPGTAGGALVLLCDQPNVTGAGLQRLLRVRRRHPAAIVASRYAGRAGVPAILPRACFGELRRLNADSGARTLLNGAQRQAVLLVDMPEAALDIDTSSDLAAARVIG